MAACNAYNPYHVPVYDMNSKPKGICLIINNTNFRGRDSLQSGAADKVNLMKTFEKLEFEVGNEYYWEDLTADQMRAKTEEVAKKEELSHYDCFVCCVNSHGNEDGVCGSDNKLVNIRDLTSPFRASNCKFLAGKPKLFFIDSCRGKTKQDGLKIHEENSDLDLEEPQQQIKPIPDEADFLLGYATARSYYAYEHTDKSKGSRFFRSLTWHLDRYAHIHDILEILTMVNYAVCSDPEALQKKIQTPAPMFTLCKKLYLGLRNIRVLVVGPSESGKRAVANTILEVEDREVSDGAGKPAAFHSQSDWRLVTKNGRRIEVTEIAERSGSSESKFNHELTKALHTVSPGPHVVLLCYRADLGFSVREKHYEWLKEFLGGDFNKYAVLVFVGRAVSRFSDEESKKVIDNLEARHRLVVFNIQTQELGQQRDELLQVLEDVLRQNAGRFFSNDDLKSYHDAIQKLPKIRSHEDVRRAIVEGEHCDLERLKKSASYSLRDRASDGMSLLLNQDVLRGIPSCLEL